MGHLGIYSHGTNKKHTYLGSHTGFQQLRTSPLFITSLLSNQVCSWPRQKWKQKTWPHHLLRCQCFWETDQWAGNLTMLLQTLRVRIGLWPQEGLICTPPLPRGRGGVSWSQAQHIVQGDLYDLQNELLVFCSCSNTSSLQAPFLSLSPPWLPAGVLTEGKPAAMDKPSPLCWSLCASHRSFFLCLSVNCPGFQPAPQRKAWRVPGLGK